MNEAIRRKFWLGLEKAHARGAFDVLNAAYTQAHRAYHSWEHIDALLERLEEFGQLAVRPDLVATAIFWHDVVHVARGSDGALRLDSENVRDSGDLFRRHTLLAGREAEAVQDLILATADHMRARARNEYYPGFSGDLDLFIDLDLSPLASPWDEFAVNTRKIRSESMGVDEAEFSAKQAAMLEGLAKGGAPLFRRAELREKLDATAKVNLARCIAALRERGAPRRA
ncbi:MAG: hypothetical protein C3F11_15965 [Methylocystaceae bacterium]|nr:MAG: hypothetical protein C3F11_15965 [Methylocystaceae bacterium]